MKISKIEKDKNTKTHYTAVRCIGVITPLFSSTCTRSLLYASIDALIIVKDAIRFPRMRIFKLLSVIILARRLN